MKTATQIYAAKFEQVTKAGVLADAGTEGAVRRQTNAAARAVVLYINAGEVGEGMRIAEELVESAGEEVRAAPMRRCYDLMVRSNSTRKEKS